MPMMTVKIFGFLVLIFNRDKVAVFTLMNSTQRLVVFHSTVAKLFGPTMANADTSMMLPARRFRRGVINKEERVQVFQFLK